MARTAEKWKLSWLRWSPFGLVCWLGRQRNEEEADLVSATLCCESRRDIVTSLIDSLVFFWVLDSRRWRKEKNDAIAARVEASKAQAWPQHTTTLRPHFDCRILEKHFHLLQAKSNWGVIQNWNPWELALKELFSRHFTAIRTELGLFISLLRIPNTLAEKIMHQVPEKAVRLGPSDRVYSWQVVPCVAVVSLFATGCIWTSSAGLQGRIWCKGPLKMHGQPCTHRLLIWRFETEIARFSIQTHLIKFADPRWTCWFFHFFKKWLVGDHCMHGNFWKFVRSPEESKEELMKLPAGGA